MYGTYKDLTTMVFKSTIPCIPWFLFCGTYKENLKSTIALYEVPIPHCGTNKKNLISTIALYEVLIPYCGTYKKKLISTTPLYKLS